MTRTIMTSDFVQWGCQRYSGLCDISAASIDSPTEDSMSHIYAALSTKVLMFGVFLVNDQADICDNVTLTSVLIPS